MSLLYFLITLLYTGVFIRKVYWQRSTLLGHFSHKFFHQHIRLVQENSKTLCIHQAPFNLDCFSKRTTIFSYLPTRLFSGWLAVFHRGCYDLNHFIHQKKKSTKPKQTTAATTTVTKQETSTNQVSRGSRGLGSTNFQFSLWLNVEK